MGRILHMIALVALVLSPLVLHRAEAAPSPAGHHSAAAAPGGDCHGSTQDSEDLDINCRADCALACSAMSSAAPSVAEAGLPRPAYSAMVFRSFAGTAPGSDPPPPRLS